MRQRWNRKKKGCVWVSFRGALLKGPKHFRLLLSSFSSLQFGIQAIVPKRMDLRDQVRDLLDRGEAEVGPDESSLGELYR